MRPLAIAVSSSALACACGAKAPVAEAPVASASALQAGPPEGPPSAPTTSLESSRPGPIIVTLSNDDLGRFEEERAAAAARRAVAVRVAATAKWAPALTLPCVQDATKSLPLCLNPKQVPPSEAQDCMTFCSQAASLSSSNHAKFVVERTLADCVEKVARSGGVESPVCHFPKPYDHMTFGQDHCDETCARVAGVAYSPPK
jgi:hypothetical protein